MSEAAFVLVDDDKIVLDSLRGQLRRAFGPGYVYETAENVSEAWEVIDELHDDGLRTVVVVSDWLMPGVRGDEFLRDVRARFPDIVRILLTGQADEDAIERAHRDAKVAEVFYKPWNIDELAGAIRRELPE
ncbi:MAG: response regulator [Deltaproteobacteria bacterium]|nr:MAG: response regulator [Deltaproteobacteria bacterium]